MPRRLLVACALAAVIGGGCSRLQVREPVLLPPGATFPPTSSTTTVPGRPLAKTEDGLRLADLPAGWGQVPQTPPVAVAGVMSALATCLGLKLDGVAGGALRVEPVAFRSADASEWVTAAIGPVAVRANLPPPASAGLRTCAGAAVLRGMADRGFGALTVRSVSVVPMDTLVVEHSLDVRVTLTAAALGTPMTGFVDLVWMVSSEKVGVLAVVDASYPGSLPSADEGLIAEVSDAVARRIAGG